MKYCLYSAGVIGVDRKIKLWTSRASVKNWDEILVRWSIIKNVWKIMDKTRGWMVDKWFCI